MAELAGYWFDQAQQMHGVTSQRSWNRGCGAFVLTFDGKAMDARMLLLAENRLLDAADPRFASTVAPV